MYPQLNVYLDDAEEPTVVQPLTIDFEIAESLYGERKTTDSGLRLVIAYCHIEDEQPKSLNEVRAWARNRKAQVILGEAPGPTQKAQPDVS
jgi:hypothetical protein